MIKKKKQQPETVLSNALVLPDSTGKPLQRIPHEVGEQLRYMLSRVQKKDRLPRRMAILSALRGEGVTYAARALAAVLAHDLKASVCLVDLNWHAPNGELAASTETGGLAGVLNGTLAVERALLSTGWPNLKVLPAGTLNPTERSAAAYSPALRAVLESLDQAFDHLVLDIPAVLSTSDAVMLARLADMCFFVIRQDATQELDVKRSLTELDTVPVAGVIFNRVRFAAPRRLIYTLSEN